MLDIEKLKTDVLLYSPFLARVLLSLPLEATDMVPTAGTDGRKIYYNEKYMDGLTHGEACGVLVHECLHVLLGHHVRAGHRKHERWNIAADYELNPYVLEAGYQLPKGVLLPPPEFEDKDAEYIYERLPKNCGGPWDKVTASPGDAQALKDEWKKIVAATSWGNAPARIRRAMSEAVTPKRTVADVLAARLAKTLDFDSETWAPPSRRWTGLPSYEDKADGYVVFCIDTSGSMDENDVRQCVSQALGVAALSRLDVVWADAAVAGIVENVTSLRDISEPKGGGGTDFRPALAEAHKRQPDVVVYMTDGEGTYGDAVENVVWVSPRQPPWGEWLNTKEKQP